jgi:hypothetical protein
MKTSSLRTHVYVSLVAVFFLLAVDTSQADHINVTGLQANNHGVANWHTTNNVVPEPVGSGHELTWLRGFPPPGAPAGDWRYYSYYYLASPSHGGINPASDSSLLLNNAGSVGFANFFQALTDNGFNVADIKVEFGLQSLGADAQGADWTYNAGVEDRTYRNSGGAQTVVFKLNGHDLFGGPMPDFHFHIVYNDLANFVDDNISGFTGTLAPANLSAGAPANVQAVAAAFIQDLAGGQIRFVFDSIQPEVQIDFTDQANARVGAILEAQSGKIELVPALPIINVGDTGAPEGDVGGQNLVFPVNLNQAPAQAVSVDWALSDGSAKAGTDFAAANGTLNLAAGMQQGNITVVINGDMDREADETFTLTLSNPNGVQLGQAQATGTIQNDDGAFIAIRGVHPENEGAVAWNASAGSPEGGPSPTHQQPDGGTSSYWFASPDHDDIVPGSMGGGHGEQPVSGFGATLAALQANGRTLGDLRIRFGPANLGGHQAGVDYTIAGNIETRIYQGGTYRIFLGNEEILNAPMPPTTMTLNYGVIGNSNDDVISGVTGGFTPVDASGGASPGAQAVAAAILQDVSGGQLRSVFEGIQPITQTITQTGLNANGRTGAYFSAPVGRLELLAGPPAGQPDLVVIDAVAGEGAGTLSFNVSLYPVSAQQVTVDYSFANDSASIGTDYTGAAGTLTFAAGETNKTVTVGLVNDSEVEINEQFFVNLANANGAPIHRGQATGVILDNDFPNFPPVDPEFYPTNTPCICTPMSGIYRTNASEIWHMKLLGTAGLLRLAAVAVSTNEPSWVEALVYNSAGTLIGSNQVSYTVAELVASGSQFYTKWVDISITNQVAGDKLRIEVHNLPPTPLTQTHYRLHGAGVRWMSTPSPSFAGFEAESTRWRFLVHSNENLVINYFTNNLPGIGPVDYTLYDPTGNPVLAATNAPIVLAPELVVSNAMAGLWTLQMESRDHYRISKNSGLDRNIYADWRTGSYSDQTVFVKLDGTNAVGANFDVIMDRIDTWGGVTNFVHYRAQLTSNGMAHFPRVQQGLYRISVNPQTAGIAAPMPQFEILACDHPLTNVFETFGGGNTNQPPPARLPIITLLPGAVVEADAGQTNHLSFGVKLSHPSPLPVWVVYGTQNGAAHSGTDYVASSGLVRFEPGDTMTNFVVPVIGDNVEEQLHERFNSVLGAATNGLIGVGFANGVIVDNDGTNANGAVAFVVADGAIYEGDTGQSQLDLRVMLTRPDAAEVRVDYATRDNSANEPSDYQVTGGTLVFAPGNTLQVVTVPVNGDVAVESNERFWLDLSNPVNAFIDSNADLIGAGNIIDDDQEGGNTNQPPAGSQLYLHDGMVREGDVTNTFLHMSVRLWPAATNTVTVGYTSSHWTAVTGLDFKGTNGLLTFLPGETNKIITVDVYPDAVFEPTELLYMDLQNAVGATIAVPRAIGVIKDNDHPDYPDDQVVPDPLPCICTPVVGNYNSNAIHSWSTKAFGGPLDIEFRLHSVNTNEAATQVIRVYDAGGSLIASNSVTMSLVEVQSMMNYSESVMVGLGTRSAGEVLRIEVELLTGPFNAHYSLKVCGSRWVGTASPSFSAFEEEPSRYRFVVQPGEDLDIDVFTNGITPDVAMQVPLRLFDPAGNQVVLPGYPTTVVAGNEIHVTNATAGIWTLEANLTNRIMGHYRLAKTSGVNRGIFFDWASGGNGVILIKITVNGAPPTPGTPFTVNSWRQRIEAGTPILEPLVSGLITSNYVFDLDPYEMLPGTYVTEVLPVGTNLGPAQWRTNFVTCMSRGTNCFDFNGQGGGGTNLPPTGSALYAFNSMIREGNITNRTMYFTVGLWPAATNTVTVDYSLAPVTAIAGVDYRSTNGLLTFPAGTTNQWVAVTILSDAVFEGPEFFHLNLSNPLHAAIADPQADGIIKDNDHPDYPGDNDDPLPFPAVAPCVCTPLAGQYETNLPQAWIVRSLGGPMDMRLYGVAVNTNDGSTIVATVYDSTGAPIATPSVTYTGAEAAAGGLGYEKWVDVPLGTHAAGSVLRVEIGLGAGTPPTQTHYRLRFCGARWIATSSPSFAGFEDDSALWRLRVDPNDTHLNIDFFTTNTPTAATAMEYALYRPDGSVASASSSLPIVAGDELSVTNPVAGLWALRCKTTQDHYRLAKSGGVDNTLYLGWRGASWSSLAGQIKLNGTNAVGTPFEVNAAYQFRVNGVLTNFLVETEITTNGMFHFERMQHGHYIVWVVPQVAGITAPAAQTNIVACDENVQLMFQTFATGGGSPIVFAPDRMFLEADTNTIGFFDIFLSAVSGSDVTVDYSTGGGTASANLDYQSTSGTVTIPAGLTNAQVGVVVIGDNSFELNKTFLLSLSNPSGATLSGTNVVGTIVNDDRPAGARFHRILRLQNGGPFRLEFDLGDNGAVYEIQASENLIQWVPIGQVTGTSGNFEFTDGDSTNRLRRYYRAIAP